MEIFLDVSCREKKTWLVPHLIRLESEIAKCQEFAAVIQEFHLSSKRERAPSC